MTTENPESSAIGQGTNAYSNVQLSRYISAVANKGTVFKLSLLDKMTDSQGNLIEDFTPAVRSQIDIQDSTWNAVHTGMRRVISDGSASKIFNDLEVPIAGKTGTAEEVKNGHTINHAFFVSFPLRDKYTINHARCSTHGAAPVCFSVVFHRRFALCCAMIWAISRSVASISRRNIREETRSVPWPSRMSCSAPSLVTARTRRSFSSLPSS